MRIIGGGGLKTIHFAYWPSNVPRQATVDAFIEAFRTLGYEPCEDGELEPDVEKVVFYTLDGKPTHAARQLSTGVWTSKLGQAIDIEHGTPKGVEGSGYGYATQFMKRKLR